MLKRFSGAALGALLALSGTATAQNYPTRPLTMIIPFAAGGPPDVIDRVMAQRLSEILGQQVIIENIGGAGGMTGSKRVADAAPDGYTFVLGSVGTHAQSQTLYKRPLYNSVNDFTQIALIAEIPIVLTVRKDLPVNDFKEFVAYAKANHGKMQFGSAGAGSATHLGCVRAQLDARDRHHPRSLSRHRPGDAGPAGGRIDFLCEIINTAKPHIDGGAVKALAIMTKERSPVLPNLPTALEQGTDEARGLYLERHVPAQERAGRHRQASSTTPPCRR